MPTTFKLIALASLLAGLFSAGCSDDAEFDPGERHGGEGEGECVDGQQESVVGFYCCDPDQQTQCICPDYWVCTEACGGNGGNGKVCDQPFPDAPGGSSEWGECTEAEGLITCTGDAETFDDGGMGSGWTCETQGEFVVCTKDAEDYPDGGTGEGWHCYWNEGERICEFRDEGDWECTTLEDGSTECVKDNPPGPDGGDWDCFFDNGAGSDGDDKVICEGHSDGGDGSGWDCFTEVDLYDRCRDETPEYPDEGGDIEWDCWYDEMGAEHCTNGEGPQFPDSGEDEPCPLGAARWCDGPIFCSWGKQFCQADFTWGPCQEEDGDRPNNSCACRHFYFDPDCCETADCVLPQDHVLPTVCESDGGLCGYCNNDDDCTGGGICLEDGHGATLCGEPCTVEEGAGPGAQGDCPAHFFCAPIRDYYGEVVANQCAPTQPNGCDL